MAKLVWDKTGDKYYEAGVDQVVLYVQDEQGAYPKGVAWNGVTNISENPSGAEPSPIYADNIKYANIMSNEEFAASVEAYTYPDEFNECNGLVAVVPGAYVSQQTRKPFGLCYRTKIGNDTKGIDCGYKLHMIYNCLAAPSEQGHDTINENVEAMTMSWELSTTPVPVKDKKPTAHFIIDSRTLAPEKLAVLEAQLYGGEVGEASLPTPDEIITLVSEPK